MKTDFLPRLQYDAGDGAGAAGAAFPWASVAQTALGIGQTLFSGKHRAEKRLEKLQTPTYGANQSILKYYNDALQRYNVNPYQSQQYQYANQKSNQNFASGINALQGRGSAVGGIAKLTALKNDADLRAGVQAEQSQSQRFGQLGGATQMKVSDDLRQYQQNVLAPYEKKYNLLALKASGANKTAGAGIQNIFGGLQGVQDNQNLNQIYGNRNRTPNYLSYGEGE